MHRILHTAIIAASYLTRRSRPLTAPLRVWIEPTNHCNLRCITCPNKSIPKKNKGFMPLNLYCKIVDELSDHNVPYLNLFLGGESLVHPQITAMVEYAKRKGLKTILNTNAVSLAPELSKALIKAGLDQITFSFDAFDRDAYLRIKGLDRFERALGNTLFFLKEKRRLKLKRPFAVFQVIELQDPKYRSSPSAKSRVLKRLRDEEINKVFYISPHNFGGGNQTSLLGRHANSHTPCTLIWYGFGVLWDGRIVPCCVDFFGKCELGNARKDSIIDIWYSRRFADFRRDMAKGRYRKYPLCRDCDVLFKPTFLGIPLRSLKGLWSYLK